MAVLLLLTRALSERLLFGSGDLKTTFCEGLWRLGSRAREGFRTEATVVTVVMERRVEEEGGVRGRGAVMEEGGVRGEGEEGVSIMELEVRGAAVR